jgi:hypothetical protein
LADFVGHGGVNEQHGQVWQESYDGTLTALVPEPKSYALLLLAGLSVMGGTIARHRMKKAA